MATAYRYERTPAVVYARPGEAISLTKVVSNAYGDLAYLVQPNYLFSYSDTYLSDNKYYFWSGFAGSNEHFAIGGQRVAAGELALPAGLLPATTVVAGNSIMDTLYYAFDTTVPGSENYSYTWQTVAILDPGLVHLRKSVPTAADVVAAAYAMEAFYGNIPNPNDCGWITDATAAAAGAPMPPRNQSIDPRTNEEGGFWRIVHRGTDNPIANWESLVRPGDIVRCDWADPAQPQHTTLYLSSEAPDGRAVVYDNGKKGGGTSTIGAHEANYDIAANPATVTIYRLTTDGLYLINGSSSGDILVGTAHDNKLVGKEGNDHIYGGAGTDVAVFGSSRASYIVTVGTADIKVEGGASTGDGTDTLWSIERIHFSDITLAFDEGAGQVYRLYQAAFSRTPDKAGVSYWVSQMDDGMTLRDLAYGFIASAEFKTAYGTNPTNTALVEKLYLNVLGRAAEKAGVDYWVGLLNGGTNLIDVVAGISESQENRTKLAPIIGKGVELDTGVVG